MDTQAETTTLAAPVTYLKVPYNGGTLRSLPFEDKHLVALTMAQQMSSDDRKFRTITRALLALLGDDGYEQITDDLVSGKVGVGDLSSLLGAIVKATAVYKKGSVPEDATSDE